jgi:hypothetical protein
MTLLFFGLLLLADFLAVVFQCYCPPLAQYAYARVLIFPAVLAYGALALPFAGALALAFFNGFLWDALTVQILTPSAYSNALPRMEISFGWSIVLYGVLAVLVHGLRPLFLRGRWDLHCLASGACAVIILAAQYLMITFNRGGLIFPRELVGRILMPGLFAMLLAPVVYFSFNSIAGLIGYPVRFEEEEPRL